MKFFYWAMSIVIVGTFVPAAVYMGLYAVTGEDGCLRRAKSLWTVTRVFTLFAFNLLIWGHVAVGLWKLAVG
jgi:hypothetical protein